MRQQNADLVDLSTTVRGGAGLGLFLTGLILLAVGAVMVAVVTWRTGVLSKWSGIPFAAAFVLYIPQFFGNQQLRVIHGLLVTAGCVWLALGLVRHASGDAGE